MYTNVHVYLVHITTVHCTVYSIAMMKANIKGRRFIFQARRRWKHSMKVVFLCNKLSRNRLKSLSGEGISETGRDSPVVSIKAGKVMAVSRHRRLCSRRLWCLCRRLYVPSMTPSFVSSMSPSSMSPSFVLSMSPSFVSSLSPSLCVVYGAVVCVAYVAVFMCRLWRRRLCRLRRRLYVSSMAPLFVSSMAP